MVGVVDLILVGLMTIEVIPHGTDFLYESLDGVRVIQDRLQAA